MSRIPSLVLLALITAAPAACVIAPSSGPAEHTVDGLNRVQSKKGVDTVYTAPGMSLSRYRRVLLDPANVAFKPDWQQRNPAVTADDIARIRSRAAYVFLEEFTRALTQGGGYAIAQEPAPDVLRVSASIVDLDIVSPPADGIFMVTTSDMTLLAELRDSQSGAILVRAADRERGRQSGNLQIASQENMTADARQAFAMWAGLLREALDSAR